MAASSKTVYFVAGKREIKLELTWKFPLCWLAFIGPEGDMQGTGRERTSIESLQLSPNGTLLTYQETGNLRHNGGLEVVEAKLLDWMWGLLDRKEIYDCYYKLGQKCYDSGGHGI